MAMDFELILDALTEGGVRFVVVGGVAVVLHGLPRFTADLDLVVALDRENALGAIGVLETLGYKPRAPVRAEDFADPSLRENWAREKGMTVFTLWSSKLPATEIDIFVQEPIPFDELSARAVRVMVGRHEVGIASAADLIRMKTEAGRPQDLNDVAELERILAMREDEDS